MKNKWQFSVNAKTGKQTLIVPKQKEYTFSELMNVFVVTIDFLQTLKTLILSQQIETNEKKKK